jgi:hypothetical protein
MGCNIRAFSERRDTNGDWVDLEFSPFAFRYCGTFGFLASGKNNSASNSISEARGLPDDRTPRVKAAAEAWGINAHNHSWLTVEELLAVNYDAVVEDRRITINSNGRCTAPPGSGEQTLLREFLKKGFFTGLYQLQHIGAERVVFWFDN